MTQSIVQTLDTVSRTVLNYLRSENRPGGILHDVKVIISGHKSTIRIEIPTIWMVEHPTVPWAEDKARGKLSNLNYLQTSFEFVCIEYDPDPAIASDKAKNLATRVGKTIITHFNRLRHRPTDPDRIFQFVKFNELIPDGLVRIEGQDESIPVAAIIFDFVYPIQWIRC